jgi:cell division septum initiation protein DivIVA
MGLPRAVQEAADAADALAAQMVGDPSGNSEPTPNEPQEPAPQTPPEQQPVTPAPEHKPVDWEHKYSTLKGMFDAEVPRLNAQNRELRESLTAMQNQIAQLQAPKEPPKAPTQLITDQDRESFGPDLVNLIERGVQQATSPLQSENERLRAELAQVKANVGSVAQQTAEQAEAAFYADLGRAVPSLVQTNQDPEFIAWLSEVDPIYGLPRKVALDNAADRRDVARTANIFNAYLATKAPVQQATPPKNDLARQVAPARTRQSAPPETKQTLIWDTASINQFYEDLRRGNIPTDEAARLEADLQAAVAEGRVR